jgi:hypothetical protein
MARKNNGQCVSPEQRSIDNYVGSHLRWQLSHSHAQLWLPPQEFLTFLCLLSLCQGKESKDEAMIKWKYVSK